MSGYIGEMRSSQHRQRPRSAIQLRIGMFSNHWSWLAHCVQRDRGRMIERSIGQRTMQTLRNDPKHAPTMNATNWEYADGGRLFT
jgi:IS1 family transposase